MGLASEGERASYYRAALECLKFVEQRRPTRRRFGADADAAWTSFRGDLATAHRLDLLIRDADAEWPCAFGARTVFDLGAAAEDEAFGAEWEPLDPVDAEELWRQLVPAPAAADPVAAARAIARAYGIEPAPIRAPQVGPADKLLVVGPGAIVAAIEAFAGGADLNWADQVTVIATPPAHRHIAAAAAALLNAPKPTQLHSAAAPPPSLASERLVSDDAAAADRAAAGG